MPAGSPHAGVVVWRGRPLPGGTVDQPQKCGVMPVGAYGCGGMLRGIVGRVHGKCQSGWGGVPGPASPLAELSAELVEDEALCSGLVSNGLIGVHDTPGLVAVLYLGCLLGELGGRSVGRGG